jgi:Fic family protein
MIITEKQFGYPVRHKRKVPFDPDISLPVEIMRLNAEIFQMEAELDRCILTGEDYEDLLTEAFASNIHLSTSMEGNPLSHEEVRKITRRSLREGPPREKLNFFSQEVYNHIFAYFTGFYSDRWTIRTIQETHQRLMIGDDGSKPGAFRKERGVVETNEGEEVFIACPPEHIPEELASLITWLNTKANALLPVVAATIFFHEFESIHPFRDGNGRCGRTLFHILLQHRGLPNSKLCLVEREIVSDLEGYYDLLARTDFSSDHTEIIVGFTRGVWRSYKDALEKFNRRDLMKSDLDDRSKTIIMRSKMFKEPFSLKEARAWVPDISEFRLRGKLNHLVDIGAIQTFGNTKGKKYIFADPTRDLMINYLDDIWKM